MHDEEKIRKVPIFIFSIYQIPDEALNETVMMGGQGILRNKSKRRT